MAFADDYIDVAERIREFRDKYPEGSLRAANPQQPYYVEKIGDKTFVVYAAAAYRTPDDQAPGIGVAWEPVPGKTNFTRDSELQNAETSAWGRAIVAVGAADTKKGIASADEVRNRQHQGNRPCPACKEDKGDRDAVRQHLVDDHGWVQQEDGSVSKPVEEKPEPEKKRKLPPPPPKRIPEVQAAQTVADKFPGAVIEK